ncbi:hypothetical protein PICST_28190 [Scheffersomyces stipitis CBS 6054]|uniref:Uncharacterized protein n=1 Tax=Scheffersomyces stipitis (strain ATCC 58785 / CBS 6054 / NBRC 10063 / NRRL Y-11545) TaxID=322104 RepID=A3GFC0_PICST|nr:predicted protein [Scheffersomyces stipitis CBS 6054]EAZ63730.2 hypothetical protein PICST_28190 [Scheffersomyces stipitis CBS 6054]
MNPISRKPRAVSRKISTPSPRFASLTQANSTSQQQPLQAVDKQDLLQKYREVGNGHEAGEDIFGGAEESDFGLGDDFKTLKISSSDLNTIRQNHAEARKAIKFDDELGLQDQGTIFGKNGYSPLDSLSTSSPKQSVFTPVSRNSESTDRNNGIRRVTKESLSDFSEGEDTDITSEFNDNDFEDLDNIFGNEESGIYDKMNKILSNKKSALQKQADSEEIELRSQLEKQQEQQRNTLSDVNATLRLRDFNKIQIDAPKNNLTSQNLNILDQIENEKTVNYEYTRDDFEEFETGFEDNFESNLKNSRSVGPKATNMATVRSKASMPILSRNNSSSVRRFKSNMDLVGSYGFENIDEESMHNEPEFNYNNNVIRKLDRIPSFYNSNSNSRNSELSSRKSQLLTKYKEQALSEKEKKRQSRLARAGPEQSKHPKLGLVKYLNNNSVIKNPSIPTNNKMMRYNSVRQEWEGNEHDLLRFDSLSKPSLITMNELQDPIDDDSLKPKIGKLDVKDSRNPHMVYDNENRRWINLREEDDSIFNDIEDLVEDNGNLAKKEYVLASPPRQIKPNTLAFKGSISPFVVPNITHLQSPITTRGISQFTQRTASSNTNSSATESSEEEVDEAFKLSAKLIDKFYKEEVKIIKKTQHWFNANEAYDYNIKKMNFTDTEYYWEIRKMVMENE